MTKNLTQKKIISTVRKHKPILKERFGLKEIYLFGSYSRNQENENSDIDFVIEFNKNEKNKSKKLIQIGVYLQNLFEKEIDIGNKDDILKEYKEYINADLKQC